MSLGDSMWSEIRKTTWSQLHADSQKAELTQVQSGVVLPRAGAVLATGRHTRSSELVRSVPPHDKAPHT